MKKIVNLEEAQKLIKKIRATGKIMVLAGGCFDVLHQGHLKFLEAAKRQGGFLIIALENDERVEKLKGKGRPVNQERVRAQNLLETVFVDLVVILPNLETEAGYLDLVKRLSPDVIATTQDDPKFKNKERQAKTVGAQVKVVIDYLPNFSTSQILKN